jgi:hypothetical protein
MAEIAQMNGDILQVFGRAAHDRASEQRVD